MRFSGEERTILWMLVKAEFGRRFFLRKDRMSAEEVIRSDPDMATLNDLEHTLRPDQTRRRK